MDQKIFNRVEKKYLITPSEMKIIFGLVEKNMQKDDYFKSEIYNIYFDTENHDLIIKSIENPAFKEKFRARAYTGYDKVFLEIKTKLKQDDNRVGYKRRLLISHANFAKFIKKETTATKLANKSKGDLQIAKEIDYLVDYLGLKPKLLVYYTRKSFVNGDGLRVTFDENLSFRDQDFSFKRKIHDKHYFNDKKSIIMEVKATKAYPLWLVEELSKNKIYPVRFSKVGKIYELIKKGTK